VKKSVVVTTAPGGMKMVKVFVAVKRKLQPGTPKMAGRHGQTKVLFSKGCTMEDMRSLRMHAQ